MGTKWTGQGQQSKPAPYVECPYCGLHHGSYADTNRCMMKGQ